METKATEAFEEGYNCAQSVLCELAPEVGLDPYVAIRLASGLGGGCGRRGEICGALSGAIVALGMKYGSSERDPEAKAQTYDRVGQLLDEFSALHGTVRCRELLGHDLSTPEGRESARKDGVLKDRCPCFVRDAASIAQRLLKET